MDTDEAHLSASSRLIATRVPETLARLVEAAAAEELISVASYARRAILQAVSTRERANGR
jgi:predicted HicB family RNase H-like nuclease